MAQSHHGARREASAGVAHEPRRAGLTSQMLFTETGMETSESLDPIAQPPVDSEERGQEQLVGRTDGI